MKQLGIGIGILFGIGVIVIVVLPFFLGYSRQNVPVVAPQGTQQTTENKRSAVGIFRSADDGAHWDEKNKSEGGDITKYQILDLAIHPFTSSIIFLGTKNAGLWRSENGGDSWQKTDDKNKVLAPDASVYRVMFNRGNPEEIYVAVFQQGRGRVLKSEDRGASFHEIYQTPVERYGVFDGFVDDGGTIYIVTGQGGFFASGDGGKSWRVVRWFKDGITRLVVDQRNSNVLYAFTEKGSLFRSENKGELWVDISSALDTFDGAKTNQKMIVDPFDSSLYLASTYGLLTSTDGGRQWQATSLIIPPEALPVLSVARDPFNQNTLYVSASTQLYRSTDRGTNWSIISSPTGQRIVDLEPDPKNRGVYFAILAK